jgi:hypothetical protein
MEYQYNTLFTFIKNRSTKTPIIISKQEMLNLIKEFVEILLKIYNGILNLEFFSKKLRQRIIIFIRENNPRFESFCFFKF